LLFCEKCKLLQKYKGFFEVLVTKDAKLLFGLDRVLDADLRLLFAKDKTDATDFSFVGPDFLALRVSDFVLL